MVNIKYLLSFIFFLITFCVHGLHIKINEEVFESAERSLLIISDNEGTIIFEKNLTKKDWKGGVLFNIDIDVLEKQFSFSILNEYENKEIEVGKKFLKAYTYYNISNEIIIDEIKYFEIIRRKKIKRVKIIVKGVDEYNNVFTNSSRGVMKEQTRMLLKGGLQIKYNHDADNDLFILLRCNGEKDFKYIYVNKNDVVEKLTFNWEELSNDLEYLKIQLPQKDKWSVNIKAKNEDTNTTCRLYGNSLREEISEIDLLIPKRFFFYDYEMNLNRKRNEKVFLENRKFPINDSKLFNYQFQGDRLPEIKPFNEEEFQFSIVKGVDEKINISNIEENLTIKLVYGRGNFIPPPERKGLNEFNPSFWVVEGINQEEITFSFPKLNDYHFELVESLRSIPIGIPTIVDVSKSIGENYHQTLTNSGWIID